VQAGGIEGARQPVPALTPSHQNRTSATRRAVTGAHGRVQGRPLFAASAHCRYGGDHHSYVGEEQADDPNDCNRKGVALAEELVRFCPGLDLPVGQSSWPGSPRVKFPVTLLTAVPLVCEPAHIVCPQPNRLLAGSKVTRPFLLPPRTLRGSLVSPRASLRMGWGAGRAWANPRTRLFHLRLRALLVRPM
jgi:hypothetical protein